MITITDKRDCCGCEACAQRCPVGCISMRVDREGFAYPHVDTSACIECGECVRICPEINLLPAVEPIKVVAAKSKCDTLRAESSSGGVFSLLAERVLDRGGVVCGAAFDEQWAVQHICVETIDELPQLRGSKYLQSRIRDSYSKIEAFLKQGCEVLFCGTPCQVAGLNRFLKCSYPNILTLDVACHGVPSPQIWRSYLESVVGDISTLRKVNFRDKSAGWRDYHFSLSAGSYALSESHIDNIYMQGFIRNLTLRPSCYACSAKAGRSCSDVTLADFWRVGRDERCLDDDKGLSLLMINSDKGAVAVDEISSSVDLLEVRDAAAIINANRSSAQLPAGRDRVFAAIDSDVIGALRQELRVAWYTYVIRRVKRLIYKILGKPIV